MVQQKQNGLVPMRMQVQSLASLSGLKDPELLRAMVKVTDALRSCISVAVVSADSCSSDWTPSLGTSIWCRRGPKKQKIKIKRI